MYVSDASRVLLNFFSLANEKPSSSVGSQSQLDSLSKHHLMLSQKCIWLQMSLTQYNIMTSFNNYLVRCYLFSRIQNKTFKENCFHRTFSADTFSVLGSQIKSSSQIISKTCFNFIFLKKLILCTHIVNLELTTL